MHEIELSGIGIEMRVDLWRAEQVIHTEVELRPVKGNALHVKTGGRETRDERLYAVNRFGADYQCAITVQICASQLGEGCECEVVAFEFRTDQSGIVEMSKAGKL